MLKISIIVPSFNQGKFLEETILSILNQGYDPLEVFIIDGASTDNSVDIIRKFESRITGWVSEKDSGQSEAINKGFQRSTGQVVSWLGSDDLYAPGTFDKVNRLFSSLPESTGVIHGNSEIFKEEKVIRYDKGYGDWSLERQLSGMTFPQPSSFIRRSALDKAGVLNNSLHYGMDYDLFSRLCMICDFKYADEFFSRYRLHEQSKSTNAISKFIEEWIIIFNSIVEGLNIESIGNTLKQNDLMTTPDNNIVEFFKGLNKQKKIDHHKMFYYFLVNVFRFDYTSSNFYRADRIGKLLNREFGDMLSNDPSLRKIIRRANFIPPGIISFLRNLKQKLVN